MTANVDATCVRPAAAAGRFYPGDPTRLHDSVDAYLRAARAPVDPPPPKILIVPHAGYPYSGPVAASAYAHLATVRDVVRSVVLVGPSHFAPVRCLAASSATAFATPLGDVPLHRAAIDRLLAMPHVEALDHAHAEEHSIEVQLPFLQVALTSFTIVPLVFGDTEETCVCEAIEAVWGGPETLIVISSDLSHYRDYDTARAIDARTVGAVLRLRPDEIGWDQACGRTGIRAALRLAARHELQVTVADVRNSGDTAGGRDRVVGYASFVLHPARRAGVASPA